LINSEFPGRAVWNGQRLRPTNRAAPTSLGAQCSRNPTGLAAEPDQLVAIDGLTEHDRVLQLLGAQRESCRQANEIALDLRNTAADFGFATGSDIAKSARTGAATVDARSSRERLEIRLRVVA